MKYKADMNAIGNNPLLADMCVDLYRQSTKPSLQSFIAKTRMTI